MVVGAKDKIDRKLVSLYAKVQTNNFDITSKVDPEKMLNSMNLMAMNNKVHIEVKTNLIHRKSNLREIA